MVSGFIYIGFTSSDLKTMQIRNPYFFGFH
jgi:hypothetical protein